VDSDLVNSTELGAQLQDGLAALGLDVTSDQQQQLLTYLNLLAKWNKHFNLSGIQEPEAMLRLHLLDSVALHTYLDGNEFLDFGSGAGLPGIPLAILNPDKHFVLVDSNGKKTRFMFQAKTALQLNNVAVENCRIEHYQTQKQLDMVMCRAFSALPEMLAKAEHLVSPATQLLAMKGHYPRDEAAQIQPGFEIETSIELSIPGLDKARHLIVIKRAAAS